MGAAPAKERGIQPQNIRWFPTPNHLPEMCTQEYILKTELGKGIYAHVYEACQDNNCNYVAKVEPFVNITPEGFEQEVVITELMGQHGISPIMRAAWICQWTTVGGPYDLGIIVMDKAYITFQNYVNAQKLFIGAKPNLSQIKFLLWKKVELMLSLGYLHTDIHANNVMFNLENNGDIKDLFLIDWNRVQNVPIYSGDQLVYFTTEVTNRAWERLLSGR